MYNVAIQLRKRVVSEDGRKITWEPDGTRTGDIVFAIDELKLARLMGPRALRAKSRRATLGHGAIVARVKNEREVREP